MTALEHDVYKHPAMEQGEGGRGNEVLQLARRIAEQALRLDEPAWDRLVLRALMELTSGVGALMVWHGARRSGYPHDVVYRLGDIPPDYQPGESPQVVTLVELDPDLQIGPALLLIPLHAEERSLGAIHLMLPHRHHVDVPESALAMLGGLIGYARLQVTPAGLSGAGQVPDPATLPASFTDPVTGLFTTGHFHTTLTAELERASRYGDCLSLLLMRFQDDVDGLDSADRERLLATWGIMLPGLLRRMDHAFALEEDTFAVILPRCQERGLRLRGEALQQAFERLVGQWDGAAECRLRLCQGGAEYQRGEPAAALLEQAVMSLAHVCETGGSRLVMLRHPLPEDDS
ncbi:GGDEF domain-containing protein [Natronocella acetinitrilica]|uniref:GGDEF domain-containing protein n=1 Tax=Natronocella acetinitrilica TaxID=414046 RepID=A0AAE3G3G7_9GAMM|nr:GGDEF domain-containing protein [Natronocella acetinitrilica]MCP1674717.1 GGDEF domain-containing protein [Natronocella acetinitrilica]